MLVTILHRGRNFKCKMILFTGDFLSSFHTLPFEKGALLLPPIGMKLRIDELLVQKSAIDLVRSPYLIVSSYAPAFT